MISLRTSFARTAVSAIAIAGPCSAQPRFEAASIKPNTDPRAIRYSIDDSRVDLGAMSLRNLVGLAFDLQLYQLDIPSWTTTDRFDVLATLPKGTTRTQVPQMLQALLTDRFGLVAHHEAREQEVYALVQAKDGAKLPGAAADNTDATFLTGRAVISKTIPPEGDGFWSVSVKDGRRTFDAGRITMPELVIMLLQYFDDPVVDLTGLNGYWRLRFDVPKPHGRGPQPATAPVGPAAAPEDPEGVSVEGSLRKFGLDLEHRKAPVDHLVIDHIERQPTEN